MLHVIIFAFGISVGTFLGAYLGNAKFKASVNALFSRKQTTEEKPADKTEEKK